MMLAFVLLIMPVVCMAEDFVSFDEDNVDIRTDYTPYEDTWEAFKKQFGRNYSEEEESLRYKAFLDRVQLFERHNQAFLDNNVSYTMDINQFTDQLVDEEWNSCHSNETEEDLESLALSCTRVSPNRHPLPDIDWRKFGIVTPVKNQGRCGSCYSFAVASTIASQLKLEQGGKLTPMSEQQLVDCLTRSCAGNNAMGCYRYINSVGGIMPYSKYPYRAKTENQGQAGSCDFSESKVAAQVVGCTYAAGDEMDMEYLVSFFGPAYVGLYIVQSFFHYRHGVFSSSHCDSSHNVGRHALTVIGYGYKTSFKHPFWIVKNSWGTQWGYKGYGLLERGVNLCGITQFVTVPKVTQPSNDNNDKVSDGCSNAASMSDVASWPTIMSFLPCILLLIRRAIPDAFN